MTRHDRLADVIARYLTAFEAGELPDRERLLSENPDEAEDLRSFFGCHDQLRELAGSAACRATPADDVADPSVLPSPGETAAQPHPALRGASNMSGQRFGDYDLIEEVARGGMGVVYKARQRSLNRIVALKMILAGQLAKRDDVRRFQAEAEAAANLDHPGIVPIYEVGEHEGQHFFAMRFVEGSSLAEVLADGPLPPQRAAEYTKTVAEAIAYAHARGVIHRDLKPANVLVEQTGQLRVTDFGVAKRIGSDSSLTSTGEILGTPGFMPPEQAAGRIHDVAQPADIYSLGAILYALLTGRSPFQGTGPFETLVQVLEGEPTLPTKVNRQVPGALELICMRCLEKQPADRYPSARALVDDLNRFIQGDPVEARPPNTWHHLRRWARRQPVLVAHLAGISMALLVIQITFLLSGRDVTYYLKHTLALLIWGVSTAVLQQLVDRPAWSKRVAALWAIVDVTWFTVILFLAESPLGPLLIGYPLLVTASGLFFRVRLVIITTISSAVAYVVLMSLRPAEIGEPQYFAIYLCGLVVVGFTVGSQVRRVRQLDRLFGNGA